MTVFMALCVGLFLAAVFAFLEAARVSQLRTNARMSTLQAADSLLAEYNDTLFDEYGVLFWEGSDAGGYSAVSAAASRQIEFIEGNYSSVSADDNYYLLGLTLSDVTVDSYELATDNGGAVFRIQAAKAMKGLLADGAVSSLKSLISTAESDGTSEEDLTEIEEAAANALETLEDVQEQNEQDLADAQASLEELESSVSELEAQIDDLADRISELTEQISTLQTQIQELQADDADYTEEIAALKEQKTALQQEKKELQAEKEEAKQQLAAIEAQIEEEEESVSTLQTTVKECKAILKDNPLKWLKKIKKQGVLALVTDTSALSSTELDQSELCTQRTLNEGNYTGTESSTTTQNLKFQYYLQKVFACYTSEDHDGPLDYELEYCLIGKESDIVNLRQTVKRLLLVREGMNYAYLQTASGKKEKALALATTIATAFGQPELIVPIEQGILAAWAYAESLSDVRILLNGYKVSLVKKSGQWHTDLDDLGAVLSDTTGKDQSGLAYEQYLQILLGLGSIKKITYRAMDLIEADASVQMDAMVSQMDCTYRFEAEPIFWNFVSLGSDSLTTMMFPQTQLLTYTP